MPDVFSGFSEAYIEVEFHGQGLGEALVFAIQPTVVPPMRTGLGDHVGPALLSMEGDVGRCEAGVAEADQDAFGGCADRGLNRLQPREQFLIDETREGWIARTLTPTRLGAQFGHEDEERVGQRIDGIGLQFFNDGNGADSIAVALRVEEDNQLRQLRRVAWWEQPDTAFIAEVAAMEEVVVFKHGGW